MNTPLQTMNKIRPALLYLSRSFIVSQGPFFQFAVGAEILSPIEAFRETKAAHKARGWFPLSRDWHSLEGEIPGDGVKDAYLMERPRR